MRRAVRIAAGLLGGVLALLLASFALPLPAWRTGELPAPPLPVVPNGPAVEMARRVWIDTDAACGDGRTTDPDDCFALLLLARAPDIRIAGISVVFGNAPLDATLRTTRELVAALRAEGADLPEVQPGSEEPADAGEIIPPRPAHRALERALEEGPLTLLALGPLTNIAAVLQARPELTSRVSRLVVVMGRRPGHLFHPAEGRGDGILFGHGPVFRDFNVDKDPDAAVAVFALRLPATLVPYQAARTVSLTGHDVATLDALGGAAGWTAHRAYGWLAFWREVIGLPGFYPFDLLAAAYVLRPELFHCAEAHAWIAPDDLLWNGWFSDRPALLVGRPRDVPTGAAWDGPLVYCTDTDERTRPWLLERLGRSGPQAGLRDMAPYR